MTKVENLTQAEKETLKNFIGTCVFEGAKFPSNTVGVNTVTIQELFNERTIDSLESYGDMIEKRNNQQGSSFKSKRGPLKFGGILATDLINALHLIIKYKEYEAYKAKLNKKIAQLKAEIQEAKTPQELRAEKETELKELEGLEA